MQARSIDQAWLASWVGKTPRRTIFRLTTVLAAFGMLLIITRTVQAQLITTTGQEPRPIEVATLEFAGNVENFLLDKGNNRLYVTDDSGLLSVLNATDYSLITTLPFAGELTLDPLYPRLYVAPGYRTFADQEQPTIQVIDTASLTVTATITNATHLSLDPGHQRIFVGNKPLVNAPPTAPVGEIRVLAADTLQTVIAKPLDGIPVYNPLRDELLIIANSLWRADPKTLTIRQDLLPEITAQTCKDCLGAQRVRGATVLAQQNLLVLDIDVVQSSGGPAMGAPIRFWDAKTLVPFPATHPFVLQPTCNRRAVLQPRLDNRIYRPQSYASDYTFYGWRIETPTGTVLSEIDGLDTLFLNPNTEQAYAGGWVLTLPTLQPIARLPQLTCIFAYDEMQGLIYAQRPKQLVVLAEAGSPPSTQAPPPTSITQLPPRPITQIVLAPNFTQHQTLFVTQYDTLYRSTDDGAHWQLLAGLPLNHVTALHVALSPDFAHDNTLFVGGGNELGGSEQLAGGVFRSTDGGDTWEPMWQGLHDLRVYDVALSPTFSRDQTVLAYAYTAQFSPFRQGKSIQRSTDGGLSWSSWITQTENALPSAEALLPGATPPPALPIRLADYGYQLAYTRDHGATWAGINLPKYLGSTVRAMLAAPDFAKSGVVYVMGEHALWRVRAEGTLIEPWDDDRLSDSTEGLSTLALSPLDRDGNYQLVIGTGGGEVWVLNATEMAWQSPLSATQPAAAQPLTARQVGAATQPLFFYPLTKGETTQLVLRNMDGSQRRAVTLPAGIDDKRPLSFSPDGAWLAYYTGAVSRPNQAASDDLALHLLNVASGELLTVATLLPPNFPENLAINARLIGARIPEVADDPQLVEGIWWGFAEALTINAWSPDSQKLAFAGAMDGPSSDLYLFDVEKRTLTRLTDGPEQITAMHWSPNGQWIWHNTVAIGFCEGCYGHKYSVASDGSQVITIPG
ncbi:MAG: hypothetical protein NT075_19175, partial [Chloroflexi bacterium]|nr:hypothetical protein [Chloroflexota bacterium]